MSQTDPMEVYRQLSSTAEPSTVPAPAPQDDPWAHRAYGMRCRTCMFFVVKQGSRVGESGQLGRCRRNAPTMSGFPGVYEGDWCGEHKLDETKL